MSESLVAASGFNLRAGISVGSSQSSHASLGCSKPLVVEDVVHVVLNEKMSSGGVRNHFVSARVEDLGLGGADAGAGAGGGAGGGGTTGAGGAGRVHSWSSVARSPVRAIQPLDDSTSGTLIFAQEGRFHFASERGQRFGSADSASSHSADGREGGAAAAAAVGASSGRARGGRSEDEGVVSESLPVHMGNITDFRVNSFSSDIVSGSDDGHVHVVNFPPDMAGVPTMKASKYVGCPVTSVRWSIGQPFVATWTTPTGYLQMLDTRDYRLVSSIQVEAPPPVYTHEHLSDVVVGVGCEAGAIRLFDVRNTSVFLSVQDPVVGSVHQLLPCVNGDSSPSSGLDDWVAFGTDGVSRYGIGGSSTGGAGMAAGSPGEDVMGRAAAGLSYSAGCRTYDLSLPAGLDMNAGLFTVPSRSVYPGRQGGTRLCGISLEACIVTFSAGDGRSGSNGASKRGAFSSTAAPTDGSRIGQEGSASYDASSRGAFPGGNGHSSSSGTGEGRGRSGGGR